MLTLHGPSRECPQGVSRRDVLRVGALGLGGLALPELLRLQAAAAESTAGQASSATRPSGPAGRGAGKSVILVWLRGGASHIDSWDMKPAAPPEVRGEFRPIKTNVP